MHNLYKESQKGQVYMAVTEVATSPSVLKVGGITAELLVALTGLDMTVKQTAGVLSDLVQRGVLEQVFEDGKRRQGLYRLNGEATVKILDERPLVGAAARSRSNEKLLAAILDLADAMGHDSPAIQALRSEGE
jgi:hypothetical protein